MYNYHGSQRHSERLRQGTCRCGSTGDTYDLGDLLDQRRIREPSNRTLFLNTAPLGTLEGAFIYAISNDHAMRIAPDGDRQKAHSVKHETLFQNANVRAAGQLYVREGILYDLDDSSGSYATRGMLEADPEFAKAISHCLDAYDVEISAALRAKLWNDA